MATAEVVVPRLESLVRLQGDPADPVHDVEFQGITFEHTTWLAPSSEGYIGAQSATQFGAPLFERATPPLAVHVEMASSIRFERCTFRHMGASGLGFYAGVTDSSIIGNVFEDIGGNGISDDLYHLTAVDIDEAHPLVRDPATLCKRNVI